MLSRILLKLKISGIGKRGGHDYRYGKISMESANPIITVCRSPVINWRRYKDLIGKSMGRYPGRIGAIPTLIGKEKYAWVKGRYYPMSITGPDLVTSRLWKFIFIIANSTCFIFSTLWHILKIKRKNGSSRKEWSERSQRILRYHHWGTDCNSLQDTGLYTLRNPKYLVV